MKKITTVVLVCLVSMLMIGTQVFADGIGGTFSEGYRMGMLTKFSVKGWVNKSGEGQLLMGREGTPYIKGSGDSKKTINPWYFSAEKDMFDSLDAYTGKYVVIEYLESRVTNAITQETPYTVKKVYAVTKQAPSPTSFEITKPDGSKSEGKRVGRIVKVSQKGNFKKTYEIIMQIGNAGNQFKFMTVQDEKMYDYAIKVLKSGKQVTVYYVEDYVEVMADTPYKIWKIEPVDDL